MPTRPCARLDSSICGEQKHAYHYGVHSLLTPMDPRLLNSVPPLALTGNRSRSSSMYLKAVNTYGSKAALEILSFLLHQLLRG